MTIQEPLFGEETEVEDLRRQVKKAKEQIKAMQAAANGMREIRHQQAKTILKQKAQIIELEQQVKKLGGKP